MAQEDSSQLKFRIDRELRDQLEKAAEKNGVSLNKEITERLVRSLEAKSLDDSKPTFGILKLIQEAMNAAGEAALFEENDMSWEIARKKLWTDSPQAYGRAVEATITILEALRPATRRAPDNYPTPWDGVFWGEYFLKFAASGKPNVPENQALATDLNKSLGALVQRIESYRTLDARDAAMQRQSKRSKK
ncbi:Arc family DNA-binding protein [Bradyrhizobium sp. Pha-3]|uniref:Arc family DNA-binding protein n=1 Tax=Bradyrhizobium sp. Pha-3 TaxID=208375 RepID=UPI0035D4EB2D